MNFFNDNLTAHAEEFLAARQRARRGTRLGPPSGILVAIGSVAAGFARVSSAVERWARRPVEAPERAPGTSTTGSVAGW